MEKKTKTSYREAVAEMEEILEKIESGELDVDELAAKVKRVSQLLKYCKEKLGTTEKEIQEIISEME
jgi:exodeoxyribonuclease VII small subunit